jgi:arylsulfatase A-like enzyme
MDRLASEGVTFTRAYSATATCAPSRFATLSGRFCSRAEYAIKKTVDTDEDTPVINPRCKLYGGDAMDNVQTTLRDEAGYATGAFGKWHLTVKSEGLSWENYTLTQEAAYATGFDTAEGLYYNNFVGTEGNWSHNLEWMTANAVDFIDSAINEDKPFFMYFAPPVPHSPDILDALELNLTQTPEGILDEAPVSGMPNRSSLFTRASDPTSNDEVGMMWLDDSLGALMTKLEALGELDNTVVIFQQDHGNSGKNSMSESGVRIASFVRYPPLLVAGTTSDALISQVDLAPTLYALAEITSTANVDGFSWLDFAGGAAVQEETVRFQELGFHRNVVSERYKYIWFSNETALDAAAESASLRYPFFFDPEQLYDLEIDPAEQQNLINNTEYAAVLETLRASLSCHRGLVNGSRTAADCAAVSMPGLGSASSSSSSASQWSSSSSPMATASDSSSPNSGISTNSVNPSSSSSSSFSSGTSSSTSPFATSSSSPNSGTSSVSINPSARVALAFTTLLMVALIL